MPSTARTIGPKAVTSTVLRICLEVTATASVMGSHIPILLIPHLVMEMRNIARIHSEDDTKALAAHLMLKM